MCQTLEDYCTVCCEEVIKRCHNGHAAAYALTGEIFFQICEFIRVYLWAAKMAFVFPGGYSLSFLIPLLLEPLSYASFLLQGRGIGKILSHNSWTNSFNKRRILMPGLTPHADSSLPYVISLDSFTGAISIFRLWSVPHQDYSHCNSYISLSLQVPIPRQLLLPSLL